MRVPGGTVDTDAEQFPTLFTSRLKAYGAGGMILADAEDATGCPRQYKMRYDEPTKGAAPTDPMRYGIVIHDVLALMDDEAIGPEDALRRCWDAALGPEWYAEAVEDLDRYLSRGSPSARLGTIATEQDLCALLYEDEDFGPVWFGGRIDWLGIDVNEPDVLHVTDYKTDRRPRTRASMKGDVQLRSYDWLVRENWAQYMTATNPQVVVHVDQIKFNDLQWWYERQEVDEWAAWAEAIARRILRDTEGEPETGPGCAWCSFKLDCPAYLRLPGDGPGVLERGVAADLDGMVAWKAEANQTIKLLKNGIVTVDNMLAEHVDAEGGYALVGGSGYERADRYEQSANVEAVHDVLGDRLFYDIAKVSVKALEDVSRGDPQLRDRLMGCVTRDVVGTTIKLAKED